jgi:hypothetical protein
VQEQECGGLRGLSRWRWGGFEMTGLVSCER